MKPTPDLKKWLIELVLRFGAKNPKFFNILAWLGAVAALLTGLPLFSAQLEAVGIFLPEAWEAIQSKVVFWAGIVVTLMANLPVQNIPVARGEEVLPDAKPGDVVTVAKVDKMPFTTAVEAKKIEEMKADEQVPPLNKGVHPID